MMHRSIVLLAPVLVSSALTLGCGGDGRDGGGATSAGASGGSVTGVCVPGSTQACLGPGACSGAQSCLGNGQAWGACDCGSAAGGATGVAGGASVGGRPEAGAGGRGTGGGVNTGGLGTGGSAIGGTLTGGTATGGVATGGAATGGVSTGGSAIGGTLTGGTATGGNPTGGKATGGTATGGDIIPGGTTIALSGSATVSWYNATQLGGGSCRFTLVSTLSGTASPLKAQIQIEDGTSGKVAHFQSSLAAQGSSLGVSFPGPNGTSWNKADIPLTLSGGQWTGNVVYDGACGGSCCGESLPAHVGYTLTVDNGTRAVSLSIGGYLPTTNGPTEDLCWCNKGNLSASFSG